MDGVNDDDRAVCLTGSGETLYGRVAYRRAEMLVMPGGVTMSEIDADVRVHRAAVLAAAPACRKARP
ncbi:hypothetical protein ACFOWE_11485 [Planomonospora corallina]|uniref:Uncharacterized protein n=1 Tax=Planomonospora corallina TaxID=1806052 RepID=A0ABV8I487_9ACTN